MDACGLWILETDLDTRTHTRYPKADIRIKNAETTESEENCLYSTLSEFPAVSPMYVSASQSLPVARRETDRSQSPLPGQRTANRLQPSDMFQLECSFHVLQFLSRNLHLRYQQNLRESSINYIFLDLKSTSTIFA